MKLEINGRGNGACPLCGALADCRIHRLLSAGIAGLGDRADLGGIADLGGRAQHGAEDSDQELEVVIYSCPHYAERKDA
jgi:hypothetical protein